MLTTAEVRWFFEGDLPVAVEEWFCGGSLWCRQEPRVDQYLVLPGCATVGAKLREGLFEIKGRVEEPVEVAYANDVRGRSDTWVKWSVPAGGAAVERILREQDAERWVSVRKRRLLRRLSFDSAEPREIGASEPAPVRGCGIEITVIELPEAEEALWWSLGLEGFGEPESVKGSLRGAAERQFIQAPPVKLGVSSSMSYAEWLQRRDPWR
jgi:hypothetical protein